MTANIVITGITGFQNRGVEAIVAPTVRQFRQRRTDIKIQVLTYTPDYDTYRLPEADAHFIANDFRLPNTSLTFRARRWLARIRGKPPAPQEGQANALLRAANLVLASGGDVFSSEYGNLPWHLQPLRYAQKHGVPVVFWAQSIGPFHTGAEAATWLEVAQASPLITVRESLTYAYVTGQLGLSGDRVHLTADPAFLLEPPELGVIARVLESYGIPREGPLIALSISQGISGFSGTDADSHFEAWRKVILSLLDQTEAHLLLIPHVQTGALRNNDRLIVTEMARSLEYPARLHIIGGEHSASTFKGLIGACDFVIAERMHAALAGLSSGVPTMVVGYSVKAQGIMTDMVGSDLVDAGWVTPVQTFVTEPTVEQCILQHWEARQVVRERLATSLPETRARALANFDLLETVLS
ncbi:MAG: polysaccharide pyruvyl transferase family protein [Anaerolineae bacterium]|nr:polysaccharide pyruvyl transferase family protein [Anaerolineae bacterium]